MHHISGNTITWKKHLGLILAAAVVALVALAVIGFSAQDVFADSVSKVVLTNDSVTRTYFVKTSRDADEIRDGIKDYLLDQDDSIVDVSFDKEDTIHVTTPENVRFAGKDSESDEVLSFKDFCEKAVAEHAVTITTVSEVKTCVDTIPYDTVTKKSSDMRKTTRKVSGGEKGKVYKHYKVTRTDNELIDKKYISTTRKAPVDKVVTIGTGSVNAVGRRFDGTTGKEIVEYAKKFVGNPYVYGGTSLTRGADCSGFIYAVYRHFGLNVPRIPYSAGKAVSLSKLQPGDIIIYSGHFAMYAGDGKVVHAINYQYGIGVTSMYFTRTPRAARRVVSDAE